MKQTRIRAAFIRGGTSKAVVFRREDLPAPEQWPAIFRAALGSPDPSMRQLDGMGGGLSSLSKICVVGPSSRPDADVDYTFAQVEVNGTTVDMNSNCGNMSSAIGPFAVDEGLVPSPTDGPTTVRIHNTNSGKIIHARFQVRDGEALVDGETAIPGVAGAGAPVELSFRDPGGTRGRGLLPAGDAETTLTLADNSQVIVTAIDSVTSAVFVTASQLGADMTAMPAAIDADRALMARLQAIRCAASVAMGIAPDEASAAQIISIPKIAMIGPPVDSAALDGRAIGRDTHDIAIRMISAGQAHRAVPVTGALALASAAALGRGEAWKSLRPGADLAAIRLATPSGIITIGTDRDHEGRILSANVIRTQRRLMEGQICLRPSAGI